MRKMLSKLHREIRDKSVRVSKEMENVLYLYLNVGVIRAC